MASNAESAGKYAIGGLMGGITNFLNKKMEAEEAQRQAEANNAMMIEQRAYDESQKTKQLAQLFQNQKDLAILNQPVRQVIDAGGNIVPDVGGKNVDITQLAGPKSNSVDNFLKVNDAQNKVITGDPKYDAPLSSGAATVPVARMGGIVNPANWFKNWGGSTAGQAQGTDRAMETKVLINKAVSLGDDPAVIEKIINNMAPTMNENELGRVIEYGKLAQYAITKGLGKTANAPVNAKDVMVKGKSKTPVPTDIQIKSPAPSVDIGNQVEAAQGTQKPRYIVNPKTKERRASYDGGVTWHTVQ